jgi:toxin FitB
MKIVLDTNVLSELMKPQGLITVKSWVGAQSRENLYITSITKAEILYGIAILPEGKRSRMLRESAQAMFREDFAQQMLNFDEQAASCFAEIAAHRQKIGRPLAQADGQIAAICLANNATIATRNVDDFLNCQIEIVNPWNQ